MSTAEVVELHPAADPADCEPMLIGALLASRHARDEVEPILHPAEFARHALELTYRAIMWLHGKGEPVDSTIVDAALQKAGYSGQAPDLDALCGMYRDAASATPAHAVKYAETVRARAQLRVVGKVGRTLVQVGSDPSADAVGAIEQAQKTIDAASHRLHGHTAGRPLGEDLDASMDRLQAGDRGLSTGFGMLDRLIGGLRPGTMTVVAGGTSAGKSLFAETVALHVVRHGQPCYAASIEMTRHEWNLRGFAAVGSVDLSRLMKGGKSLTDDEWERVSHARQQLDGAPLMVDDRESVSVADIRAGARTWFRRYGPGLIVVDYLQLVRPSSRQPNREREVAEIAEDLRAMGKTLAVPVLALSQINDEHLKGRGGSSRPGLQSMRESRVIAQTADTVVILWRDVEKNPHMIDVNVAKNRNGPTEHLSLRWEGQFARMSEPDGLWHQPGLVEGGVQ